MEKVLHCDDKELDNARETTKNYSKFEQSMPKSLNCCCRNKLLNMSNEQIF